MAQNAKHVYSGPIKSVEISDDDAIYVDIGMAKGDAEITWEPTNQESSLRQLVELYGIGLIVINLLQSGSTVDTVLKDFYRELVYLKITTVDGEVYKTVSPSLITRGLNRNDGEDAHYLALSWQLATQHPDDFIAPPTDA